MNGAAPVDVVAAAEAELDERRNGPAELAAGEPRPSTKTCSACHVERPLRDFEPGGHRTCVVCRTRKRRARARAKAAATGDSADAGRPG